MLLFDRSEYLNRVARVKRAMSKKEIDVLLIASPANQFWLTGYDGWSFYTPQMVALSVKDEEPIWIGRGSDAVGAKFTAFIKKENIVPYDDFYVASSERHPMEFVAEELKRRCMDRGTIGVETDDYYYTAKWDAILRRDLPDARFTDAFLLVNWCRMVKSEAELEFMRQAGKIAAAAQQAAFEAAKPGVRQSDVMAEVYRVTTAGIGDIAGTFPCKPPNAMVGEYCAAPHLSWTDAPLAEGDLFYMELGGVRHRYHSPLSRCIYVGKPPERMTHITNVVAEGLEAVLAKVKPGVVCEELFAAFKSVITKYGFEKNSRVGYPVGIGFPPTWGELTVSLRPGEKTVLEKNMTFHCMPAIRLDHYSLVVSESFAVTENGAECFASYPRKLMSTAVQ